jgi:hypothetical protein
VWQWQWQCGSGSEAVAVAVWQCVSVAVWQWQCVAVWQCGSACGSVAVWQWVVSDIDNDKMIIAKVSKVTNDIGSDSTVAVWQGGKWQ